MKTINTLFVLLLSLGITSWAQSPPQFTVSTMVGGAPQTNIPATSAVTGGPIGVAIDSSGNLFFSAQDVITRVDGKTGTLTVVAGNGTEGFSGDNGSATNAQFNRPGGVAVDSAGNLYVADTGNNRVRKISGGIITTVAGTGTAGFSGDNGSAIGAALNSPYGIAVDATGTLYIADEGNVRIRKITNGIITTVAGNGTSGFGGDNGPPTAAQLASPTWVAVDSSGNLYIADSGNYRIRKITSSVITTAAGNGTSGFGGDNGAATSAQVAFVEGIAVDSAANVYIADTFNNRIRKISSGTITTVAGIGTPGSSGDSGPATSAQLNYPLGLATDSTGNVYMADYANSRIRKISGGTISTVAGNPSYGFSGDNGPATSAQLQLPQFVTVDGSGNLYISDSYNDRVRKVSGGLIATVAGSALLGFSGDNGPATSAELSSPVGIAVDSSGNLYIADENNQRIRKVSNGVITTIAGNGTVGFSGDGGAATSAQVNRPLSVAVDSSGNLYFTDAGNNRIRKVSGGIITTVAGSGIAGFSGDNGPAISAKLNNPEGIALDSAGNLYIADTVNHRIRMVSGGTITTIAGSGTAGFTGDNGPATSAEVNLPVGIAVDATGNIYVADYGNTRVRMISSGVITTIAGNGTIGLSGDNGPATSAAFSHIVDVAVSSAGNIYVADSYNNRIRLLTPSAPPTCTYSLNPTSLQSPAAGGNFSVAIQTTPACAWSVSGLPSWITVSGANSGSGPGTVSLVIAANTGTVALTATLTVAGVSLPVTEAAPTISTGPTITAGGVVSASAFGGFSAVAPGSWVEIYGTNLASTTRSWTTADFNGNNAPTSLSGTSVTIGGQSAFIDYISPTQVNVQIPSNVATGPQPLAITTATGTSTAYTINVNPTQPGLLAPSSFLIAGTQYVVALFTDGVTYALPPGAIAGITSQRAKPGDTIVLYGVGFGATTPNIPAGQIAGQSNMLAAPFQLSIGGQPATVEYSGLAPGFVGLYQFNVVVPSVAASDKVPVIFTLGTTAGTQTLYVSVGN